MALIRRKTLHYSERIAQRKKGLKVLCQKSTIYLRAGIGEGKKPSEVSFLYNLRRIKPDRAL